MQLKPTVEFAPLAEIHESGAEEDQGGVMRIQVITIETLEHTNSGNLA